jgi:hypothetical protein
MHQIDALYIDQSRDFLIAADLPGNSNAGEKELYNIVRKEAIQNLIYVGVHENMCIMGRPFAIEQVASWGWPAARMAVMRELVDVSYNPSDSPYVSHATGLSLHTQFIEKFWASSVSMYDLLVPEYSAVRRDEM